MSYETVKCEWYIPVCEDMLEAVVKVLTEILFHSRNAHLIDIVKLNDGRYCIEYSKDEGMVDEAMYPLGT